jgi:hypothetical protein
MVHNGYVHRAIVVEVRDGQAATRMRLRERVIPGSEIVEEVSVGIPKQK